MSTIRSAPQQLPSGAREHTAFQLQRCTACGAYPNYPRVRCPNCFGQLEWTASPGTGTLTSLAVVRRTHDARYEPYVPIVMGHIALDEGVEIISTLVGDDRLEARLGDRVRYASDARWSVLPQFQLEKAGR